MNLINCSLNCVYQQDGLCGRDNINNGILSKSPECAFYEQRSSSGDGNKTTREGVVKNG